MTEKKNFLPTIRFCNEAAELEVASLPGVLVPLDVPPSGLSSLLNKRFSTLVTLFTLVKESPMMLGVEPPLRVRSRVLTLLALLQEQANTHFSRSFQRILHVSNIVCVHQSTNIYMCIYIFYLAILPLSVALLVTNSYKGKQ